MSATELKLRIINKITTIEDELILEEIFRLTSNQKWIPFTGLHKTSEQLLTPDCRMSRKEEFILLKLRTT